MFWSSSGVTQADLLLCIFTLRFHRHLNPTWVHSAPEGHHPPDPSLMPGCPQVWQKHFWAAQCGLSGTGPSWTLRLSFFVLCYFSSGYVPWFSCRHSCLDVAAVQAVWGGEGRITHVGGSVDLFWDEMTVQPQHEYCWPQAFKNYDSGFGITIFFSMMAFVAFRLSSILSAGVLFRILKTVWFDL